MDLDAVALWLATRSDEAMKEATSLGIGEPLLNGRAKDAWQFVEKYRSEYSALPSTSIIVENSGCVIKPPDEEERVSLQYIADKLHERAEFRALQRGLGKSVEALENANQGESVQTVLRLADHLRAGKVSQLQARTLGDVAPEVLQLYERVKRGETGVPFPWPTMTRMTLGLWPGTLTFFVARPSVGKTWTAVIIALHAWAAGKKVIIVSPELGRVELGERLVAKHGGFSYGDVVSGTLGTLAEVKFREVITDLHEKSGGGLYILDNEERLGPDYVEQAVDAIGPDLLLIDSLYMLKVERGAIKKKGGGQSAQASRQDRVNETIEWMRSLSRRKNIPIVGIHQLSREGKVKAESARAIKAGRGTGGMEQTVALSDALYWNAHNLFAMYQDRYMLQDKQLMYVPLKVRRQAQVSSLVIRWDLSTMSFDELGTKVDSDGYEDKDGGGSGKEIPF